MRGILKKSGDSQGAPRLRWDEDNLMMTESQKNSTMKITEPKTPFIHYNQETDEILGNTGSVPPLELSTAISTARGLMSSRSEDSMFSDSDTNKSPSIERRPSSDWSEGEDETLTEEERAKRDRFAKLRSQHYNMKEVLQKAKRNTFDGSSGPYSRGDDDEDEDEDDDAGAGGYDVEKDTENVPADDEERRRRRQRRRRQRQKLNGTLNAADEGHDDDDEEDFVSGKGEDEDDEDDNDDNGELGYEGEQQNSGATSFHGGATGAPSDHPPATEKPDASSVRSFTGLSSMATSSSSLISGTADDTHTTPSQQHTQPTQPTQIYQPQLWAGVNDSSIRDPPVNIPKNPNSAARGGGGNLSARKGAGRGGNSHHPYFEEPSGGASTSSQSSAARAILQRQQQQSQSGANTRGATGSSTGFMDMSWGGL